MGWDVSIMRFSRSYDALDEIPEDERCLNLGAREEVHQAVLASFPGTDWSDPAWGRWESEFGSIEFNLGDDDPAESMMLHVRAGDQVVAGIVTLCKKNEWQAIDCSMGDFLEKRDDPTLGLNAWREYRDRVIVDLGHPRAGGLVGSAALGPGLPDLLTGLRLDLGTAEAMYTDHPEADEVLRRWRAAAGS